ncbi:endoplasmic reticulum metallopeptidase 1-like [Drosophila subobscura]|uniref:endoplasmic reticulum metallopeptidase 1-like n=1 Tax=Drosophila subobscura TaxID=7241 RepID=UPI00155A9732|nr:endoplasmic reticulum metallopeptidase 1-like [Drosophila subobscura]
MGANHTDNTGEGTTECPDSTNGFKSTMQLMTETQDGDSDTRIDLRVKDGTPKQLPWYYGPVYLLFWVGLFFAVVYPLFNYLPTGVKVEEESAKAGTFVAQRAESILLKIDLMGPKIAGDYVTEVLMVQFLLEEIEKVRQEMRQDLYELEVDVQRAEGAFLHWQMINMYQGIQNVVVKLSAKSSNSTSYLLVNSHYDSKPSSVGTGDAEFMVVAMLEVLRLMAISDDPFLHPIVFLFNGAEEQPFHGSHGFISQHKWAANCKALINLDSAGCGGREILFQGGPNHPWLMKHYKQSAKHPFATTMAEEVFQADLIPSDTDFRIFHNFGPVPGLDMAGCYNGFVYHTKFDRFSCVSRDALQNTGDNVLALVQSFSNAEEMYDTEAHSEGHSVFFDYLGLFFVYYKESTGVALNICFSLGAIVLVCLSLWRMARVSRQTVGTYARAFGMMFLLAILGFLLALGFPLLMSVFYDAGDRTMTYFTNSWLVIGIFICPSLLGLILPLTLYLSLRPSVKIPHTYHLQIAGHAYCVFLAIICILLTVAGIRTAYLFLICIFFYVCALIINLLSRLHDRGYLWALVLGVCQILPYLYFTYLFHGFLVITIPMTSRKGMETNPDMLISLLCALGTILSMIFVAPLINLFRRPKSMLGGLALIMFIFCMISVSEVGFPYRPKTNVMRLHFLEVHRKFYAYDGSLSLEDSGYYFDLQDRRLEEPLRDKMNLTGFTRLDEECKREMKCGMPCFNHRWCAAVADAHWMPRTELVELPSPTVLELLNKTVLVGQYDTRVRYDFKVSGPPRMSLFVLPLDGVKILRWSFLMGMLDNPVTYKPPYHIFFGYGSDDSPVEFYFELRKDDANFEVPLFELAVAGHYMSHLNKRDAATQRLMDDLPAFAHPMEWPTSYERYIF